MYAAANCIAPRRIAAAGQSTEGAPEILIVPDAGYDAQRIDHLLSGLPVQVLGRLRSDRVIRRRHPHASETRRAAGG